MTREEAIAYIREWLKDEYALNSKDKEALEMAIKALEQTDGDLISREVVIEWLKGKDIIKLSSQEEMARKELKALSSKNVAVKTKRRKKNEQTNRRRSTSLC